MSTQLLEVRSIPCPEWCGKTHSPVDTTDPREGVVHSLGSVFTVTPPGGAPGERIEVEVELYPSGEDAVWFTHGDQVMRLSLAELKVAGATMLALSQRVESANH
jgi:hypothetical protein